MEKNLWKKLDRYFNAPEGFFSNLSNVYEGHIRKNFKRDLKRNSVDTRKRRGIQGSLKYVWNAVIDNAPGKTDWLKCGEAK